MGSLRDLHERIDDDPKPRAPGARGAGRRLMASALAVVMLSGLLLFASPAAAQDVEDDVDGCTAVPDSGPGFDFTEACNTHDRCYLERPYGDDRSARKQCDVDFFWDMVDLCRERHDGGLALRGCYSVAAVYYLGVRAFGGFGWVERNTGSLADPATAA
ncbi:MAG: phospholipase A2 [Actinomycetota bacterium]